MNRDELELFEDLIRRLICQEEMVVDGNNRCDKLQLELDEANELMKTLIAQRDSIEQDLAASLKTNAQRATVLKFPLLWDDVVKNTEFNNLLACIKNAATKSSYRNFKIDLIRLIRELMQCSLKDAKKMVEGLAIVDMKEKTDWEVF